jgi:membrane fusion protein (multidrug efflux system)
MQKTLRYALPFVILIIGFVVMRQLLQSKKETPKRTQPARPRLVNAKVVELMDVQPHIEAFGTLSSAQTVTLTTEVSGLLLAGDVPFQAAQSFKKGDVLVRIDNRQVSMNLNTAKSDFMTAVASVLPELKMDYPAEYEEWQTFFDGCCFTDDFRPLPQTQNQRVKLLLSRFLVFKLYFAVKNLEIRLEKHTFIAPFNGSIVSIHVQIGSNVGIGTQLGEIINLESMEVEVPVPAIDIQYIERGKPIRLTSSELTGEWRGSIDRIGKNIDARTQAVQVFISIDPSQSGQLFNNIFLKADIPAQTIKNAIIIPRKNIYEDQNVYLIKKEKLAYTSVQIGFKEADAVIVTGGLAPGDTLVTDVLQGVTSGMRAEVVISAPGEGSPE